MKRLFTFLKRFLAGDRPLNTVGKYSHSCSYSVLCIALLLSPRFSSTYIFFLSISTSFFLIPMAVLTNLFVCFLSFSLQLFSFYFFFSFHTILYTLSLCGLVQEDNRFHSLYGLRVNERGSEGRRQWKSKRERESPKMWHWYEVMVS